MAEISPIIVRLRELVADGEWRPRDELIEALAALVPPGVAWRTAERCRMAERRRRGLDDGPRVHHTVTATAVRTGARQVAAGAIQREVQRGRLERRQNGDGIELRQTR